MQEATMRTWMLAITLATGCAGMQAAERSGVQLERSEPSPSCRLVGGEQAVAATYDAALAELQKGAARRGGDLAVIDSTEASHAEGGVLGWVTVYGRVYSCAAPSSAGLLHAGR
jgi:hypothetical protein